MAAAVCKECPLFDISESMVITESVAKAILDAIDGSTLSASDGNTFGIDEIVKVCTKLDNQGLLCKRNMSRLLASNLINIPMEVLIKLVNAGLLLWADYMENGCESHHSFLWRDVRSKIKDEDSRGVILDLILSFITVKPRAGDIPEKVCRTINRMICDIIEIHDFSCIFTDTKKRFLLPMICDFDNGNRKMNLEFFVDLFSGYLTGGSMPTIEESYRQHKKWTFRNLNENAMEAMECFVVSISADKIQSIVSSSVRDDACNIRRLLSFLSVWIVTSEDSIPNIKPIIEKLLVVSLEVQNSYAVKLSLLVARHCSLEHNSGFPSYGDWLRRVVGELGGLFASNRDTIAAYIKCLSEILPLESRDFLSTHLSVLPQASASAKNLVSEYAVVAKTMLKDLAKDESSSAVTSDDSVSVAARADVQRGLRHFQETGTISKAIAELSVFRKGYFVGSFLPVLLHPETVKGDTNRQSFVDELRKAGKVPRKMYSKYCQELEKEKASVCFAKAGSNFDEIFDIVIGKIEELPQLVKGIAKIQEPKRQRAPLQLYVASLLAHFVQFQDALGQTTDSRARRQLRCKEVIDVLLDNLCNCYVVSLELEKSPFEAIIWLIQPIIRSFQCHYKITFEVKKRLLELLSAEMNTLEKYHLQALAGIVSALEDVKTVNGEGLSFVREAVFCSLGGTSRSFTQISKSLEFITYALLFCKKMYADVVILQNDIVPEVVILDEAVFIHSSVLELWVRLRCRLCTTMAVIEDHDDPVLAQELPRIKEVLEIAETLEREEMYSTVLGRLKMNASAWIEFEIEINEKEDLLPQCLKTDYYYRVIDLYSERQQSSDGWTYSDVAIAIVVCMLNSTPSEEFFTPLVCGRYDHNLEYSSIDKSIDNLFVENTKSKSAKRSSFRTDTSKPSFNSLLCLLHSLNEKIELGAETDECDLFSETRSWLFRAIDISLSRITDEDMGNHLRNVEAEINSLCSVLDALPSELLFSSTTAEIDTDEAITLINKVFRAFSKGEPYLPCSITIRFLAALMSNFCGPKSLEEERNEGINNNLQYFFSACPILSISLVKHSRHRILARDMQASVANGIGCFKHIIDLIDAIRMTDYQGAALTPLPSMVVAVSIYNDWLSKQPYTKKGFCLSPIMTLNEDQLEKILECLLWNLLSNLIQGQALSADSFVVTLQPIIRLVTRIPSGSICLVRDILQGGSDYGITSLRPLVIKKHFQQLFPMAVIKVLAGMDSLYLRRFSRMENCRETIAQCIEKCSAVMNSINTKRTESVSISPFDLSFLKEVSKIEKVLEMRN